MIGKNLVFHVNTIKYAKDYCWLWIKNIMSDMIERKPLPQTKTSFTELKQL